MRWLVRPAQVDVAVEVLEAELWAAAVEGAVDGAVHLDPVHAVGVALAVVAAGVGGGGAAGLEVETVVHINVALVGLHAHVGFDVGGQGDVDVAVERAEGTGLAGVEAGDGGGHFAVEAVGHDAAADLIEGDGAVDVLDVDVAGNAGHVDEAAVDGVQ